MCIHVWGVHVAPDDAFRRAIVESIGTAARPDRQRVRPQRSLFLAWLRVLPAQQGCQADPLFSFEAKGSGITNRARSSSWSHLLATGS